MAGKFGATVIGAGPAGICAVANLLSQHVSRILWVDPFFNGGRIQESYREVPSNTKVSLFVQFAEALEPFKKTINSTSEPHAVSLLRDMKQDEGCSLAAAANMCQMLTTGLLRDDRVMQATGVFKGASLKGSKWDLRIRLKEQEENICHSSDLLVLCSGSHPKKINLPVWCKPAQLLLLDVALKPSLLRSELSTSQPSTVAVIGTSHSAVLALLNLYTLATTTHPGIKIKWFARSPLLYAKQMDGWILRDNTGLKGLAATWAKEHLEDDKLRTAAVSKVIEKIQLQPGHSFTQSNRLRGCSHVVQAIGYEQNRVPDLWMGSSKMKLEFNPYSGSFNDAKNSNQKIKGLYGAGIAFPERVKDPHGNVENAVGMFKFMKFLKRVVPEWTTS